MIRKIILFSTLLFLVNSSYANELICTKQMTIQIPDGPKTAKEEITDVCYHEKSQTFISESCKNKKCLAYTENKIVFVEWSEYGTPGSRLCYKLGGKAQIVKILINKKEIKTDRCYFEKDKSFVDIGTLVQYNGELENKLKEKL